MNIFCKHVEHVLEAIYVFKLVLKPLEFKFMFGTNVFVKQVLYIEVLNEFIAN